MTRRVLVEAEEFLVGHPDPPGLCRCPNLLGTPQAPHTHSSSGTQPVLIGDWIVKEVPPVSGYYPMSNRVFVMKFEPIEERKSA
jgi:hypothetical protein